MPLNTPCRASNGNVHEAWHFIQNGTGSSLKGSLYHNTSRQWPLPAQDIAQSPDLQSIGRRICTILSYSWLWSWNKIVPIRRLSAAVNLRDTLQHISVPWILEQSRVLRPPCPWWKSVCPSRSTSVTEQIACATYQILAQPAHAPRGDPHLSPIVRRLLSAIDKLSPIANLTSERNKPTHRSHCGG